MSAELLSPAGDFETALAAFEAGADAVYCGLSDFSARAFAKNLSLEELERLLAYSHAKGKKTFITFNTLVDDRRFGDAVRTVGALSDIGADAVIVQDLGVARTIRRHFGGLEMHASTQLVVHNLEGVLAMKDIGFRRVVLARELSLDEVRQIAKRCGAMRIAGDGRPELELEVFIHGALCYSISGLCLFGAMERGRSGNRGKCPYCCRTGYDAGAHAIIHPFSMKDLRVGADAVKLSDSGVSSLKIEGRMKSPLYVASVTKYYRDILDGVQTGRVSEADLETVFSRRTTKLYLDGIRSSPIDDESIGHVGVPVGTVKKVTIDRAGIPWLRFHTNRALEKHDGLQFDAFGSDGRRIGIGIGEMRQALSRNTVFKVAAGDDVEIRIDEGLKQVLRAGMKVYCSMSNAVKRMFPAPSFRPSDYDGGREMDVSVVVEKCGLEASATIPGGVCANAVVSAECAPARDAGNTTDGIKKAFSKLGGTGYRIGKLTIDNEENLFAPISRLNELRRDIVSALDEARRRAVDDAVRAAMEDDIGAVADVSRHVRRCLKTRLGQTVPAGAWDELVVSIAPGDPSKIRERLPDAFAPLRLALPTYTVEQEFGRLRGTVNRLAHAGFEKWECSDLATLRMLKSLGIEDITADWTLYAFNVHALAEASEAGAKRFVASPENEMDNLRSLAQSGYDVEFLVQQSTPLFISLAKPEIDGDEPMRIADLMVFRRDGLWVTTKQSPRTFNSPEGVSTRIDLSWDPS